IVPLACAEITMVAILPSPSSSSQVSTIAPPCAYHGVDWIALTSSLTEASHSALLPSCPSLSRLGVYQTKSGGDEPERSALRVAGEPGTTFGPFVPGK